MKSERTSKERVLTFLLLPAVTIAVLVLSGGSFRASFQLDKLREQAVVEASLELANARASLLDQLIIDQDNAVASEVNLAVLPEMAERWLETASRQTPTVRAVMVLEMQSPQREVLAYASRAPGVDDDHFRHRILYRLLGLLELDQEPKEQLRHLHETQDGHAYLLSYWQRRFNNDWYLVIAWHDVPRLVHEYLPSLYGKQGTQNRVNVVDAKGRIIFGPPLSDGEFTVGRQFQTTLYKWRLNVALNAAEQLAARTERRLLIEIGLAAISALVVIAGMAVILTAAARERRLANMKSEFVANVSHELKTPLSLIRMFGELLQTRRVGSPQKRDQYIDIIVTESVRLTALIENVLNFAKLERGSPAYEFNWGDLREVLKRAVELMSARAEREGTKLELELPEHPVRVRMDERALEIAVTNLIDNALKYARDGGWVGVSVWDANPRRVAIIVKDRGSGIPSEDRRRIFDRFVRRESKTRVRGSGIGLALVKSIAEAHGGAAWVVPNVPHGSAFHFTLKKTSARTASKRSVQSIEPAES